MHGKMSFISALFNVEKLGHNMLDRLLHRGKTKADKSIPPFFQIQQPIVVFKMSAEGMQKIKFFK